MNINLILDSIKSTISEVLNSEPSDLLLATKQEDYLSYRISSDLTKLSTDSYFPTQFKRHDIVELDGKEGKIEKIFESKFHYSSDFSTMFSYGEKCTKSDYEKLASNNCTDKYLIQFVVHFNKDDLPKWDSMLNSQERYFKNEHKYFTYISDNQFGRFNENLNFRNTGKSLYSENFKNFYVEELNSYGLNISNIGHFKIDKKDAVLRICGYEYSIPHEFHCFIWKLTK